MSMKTTYTCDLCKKEQDTYEQFWSLGISVDHFPRKTHNFSPNVHVEVCRACIERLGFLSLYETIVEREKKREEGKEPPTTAEKLEEIVQEMVDNSVEWTLSNQ